MKDGRELFLRLKVLGVGDSQLGKKTKERERERDPVEEKDVSFSMPRFMTSISKFIRL